VPFAVQRSRAAPDRVPDVPMETGLPAPVAPSGVGNVSELSPSMRRALAKATDAAAADGVELRVTSGWRSAEHQQQLYTAAIRKYGSAAAARRWVLPPEESAHVRGAAVDVGPEAAARWLEVNGVRFGLCRRYANESWHFERLAAAVGSVCPPLEPHP
jgi:hypothetical protein